MGANIDIQKILNDKKLEIYDFTEDWKSSDQEILADESSDQKITVYENYQKLLTMKKYFTYKMAHSEKPEDKYKEAQKFWKEIEKEYSERKGRGRRYYIPDRGKQGLQITNAQTKMSANNILKMQQHVSKLEQN